MGRPKRRHAAWLVRRASLFPRGTREWLLYAFDPSERPVVGVRKREWTAIAQTEEAVVAEMARCLREISEGRVPK